MRGWQRRADVKPLERSFADAGAGPLRPPAGPHPLEREAAQGWISRASASSSLRRRHGASTGPRPRLGPAGRPSTRPCPTTRRVRAPSTTSRPIRQSRPTTGARWWWSISPPPPGALALAVAQDMGITVGYPPELSMRRTADPAPDSAKTDAKDAAVIAGAARTMPPHPARHQHLGGGHRGAEHALTGFDPDPARQVNQSEGHIRGQSSSPPHDPQPTTELSAAARHTA